ncbi:hypothetical protein ACTQV1_03555 [Paratractidigestivibacter faecalis]|uniref:hypothetical protein n=1 Tax=Paratractidigestivibacter faecalis TaxID=2292441 RepID=UPI0034E8AD52
MRQKLVLTGALLHDPTLLVLDEPFVGLDPSASHELNAILRERADAGGAVFFSSHVLEVVERLCDTVAVIRRGELVALGPTDEVRGWPRSRTCSSSSWTRGAPPPRRAARPAPETKEEQP